MNEKVNFDLNPGSKNIAPPVDDLNLIRIVPYDSDIVEYMLSFDKRDKEDEL